MPDIGLIELALIGLIGFLVLGPERLPDFFAQVANVLKQARVWAANLKMQLDQERQQLQKPAQQIKKKIKASVESVEDAVKEDKSKP